MIIVNKPYITKTEKYTRLCCKIEVDESEDIVWYEVENEYAEYLCYEKVDAFVVAILPYAMAFGHDIKVVASYISETLYWQLTNLFIPTLHKYSNYYKEISLDSKVTNLKFDTYAVGTGFSAGVDSFFSILKNRDTITKSYNLTHVTYFNVGANGSYGGMDAENRFKNRIELFEEYVNNCGLKFVKVNSNISDFIMMSFNFTHSYRSFSAVLALQKLFKKYYYSAGFSLKEFAINPYDSAYYDLLNAYCFSVESTDIYTTGSAESRVEKLMYIAEYPETYTMLNVCNLNDSNCKTCEKCIRTMAGLYSINKLEKYKDVFDIQHFRKHRIKNMAFVLSKSADGTPEGKMYDEIVEQMKKNRLRIPVLSYLVAIPMLIKFKTIYYAKKNKWLRRWWHKRLNKQQGIRYNDI